MTLYDRLRRLFNANRVPVAEEDREESMRTGCALGEPPSLAQGMTAARLQSILRQAEMGDPLELFSLYRDIRLGHAHTQGVINQRFLAVLSQGLTLVPQTEGNAQDERAAAVARVLVQHPGWRVGLLSNLLLGHLYPVTVIEQTFVPAPASHPLGLRWLPDRWRHVPFHLYDFTDGRLKLWEADKLTGARLGTRRELGEASDGSLSEMRHIVHRGHLLTDVPDNWGGPMRAVCFWWLFAVMDRDWWARFLDRFGAPFLVGKVDASDDKSRRTLTNAFAAATKLFGLVVSKEAEIEVNAVQSSSHGEAFEKFQSFANAELSKLILGQTMTVSAQAGGLGGAQAEVQANVLGDIQAFDLSALADTINQRVIAPFLRINGVPGTALVQAPTDNTTELKSKAEFLKAVGTVGLEPDDSAIAQLSKASGIQLRRASGAALPFSLEALSTRLPDNETGAAILRRFGKPLPDEFEPLVAIGAERFAKAFAPRHQPLLEALRNSQSLPEFERALAAHFSTIRPAEAAEVMEEILTAYAATGCATARTA